MAFTAFAPKFNEITPDNAKHADLWFAAMDWARLEVKVEDLKAAFIKWTTDNNNAFVVGFEKLPTWQFQTVGRIALLLNNGAIAPETTTTFFARKISELESLVRDSIDLTKEEEVVLDTTQKRTIDYVNQFSFIDVVRTKFADNVDEVERLVTERLKNNGTSRLMLKNLYAHFKESLDDAFKDKEIEEVEATIPALVAVVNVLASFTGNAKVASLNNRTTKRAQKQTKNVTVKAVDVDTNTVSLSPATIPGSSAVVVYNTKTRKASIYRAPKGMTLSVKGMKITDFDDVASFAKTLRRPTVTLKSLRDAVNSSRVGIVLSERVKGKSHKVTGHLNKDTVIVKVYK